MCSSFWDLKHVWATMNIHVVMSCVHIGGSGGYQQSAGEDVRKYTLCLTVSDLHIGDSNLKRETDSERSSYHCKVLTPSYLHSSQLHHTLVLSSPPPPSVHFHGNFTILGVMIISDPGRGRIFHVISVLSFLK